MNHAVVHAAKTAVESIDKSMRDSAPDEVVNVIQTHAVAAVAAAWIPVSGLDVAALTANTWAMYVRINRKLGISFSENLMKSIGSAVAANLASNLAVAGIGSVMKWIPGIGTVAGGLLMSATMYGVTVGAAWIYLVALVHWVRKGKGSEESLKEVINKVMTEQRDEINGIIKSGKKEYKKR